MRHGWIAGLVTGLFMALMVANPVLAEDSAGLRDVVDKSRITFTTFMSDSNLTWFRDHVKDAKGVLIVPQLLKGAFFVGAAGGSGVLLVRDSKTNEWSEPAFYTVGSGSFGFQFGAQASEVILLIMTQRGIDSLLHTASLKLGADATVAIGPVGAGMEGASANLSADILSFARSKGLFAGISLEGGAIVAVDDDNSTYYGKTVRPEDILIKRQVSNAHSGSLRSALAQATIQTSRPHANPPAKEDKP